MPVRDLAHLSARIGEVATRAAAIAGFPPEQNS